ncbi:MAG TPA: UDP-N-acetylmuramate dehydrogenase [Bacteroidia bacterium]|jgi:UDP-N-acetylmuramate dehydrogenase|nr:UDP-N-acetylmuramate dehydrogenase [Bacteroidia bacterium]
MQILENHPLKTLNTFGIESFARFFSELDSVDAMKEFLNHNALKKMPKLILGGGSNLLLTQKHLDFAVLKNSIKGIEKTGEDKDFVYVRSGAGENWNELVQYCIRNNYAGIENLSLIPGNVGAGPMQNIGAYGVELKDVFHRLEALHISDLKTEIFNTQQCEFGYRESVFKRAAKGKYIITTVTLRLNKKPVYSTSYGAISKELENMGVKDLSISAISKAVCNIRSSKLPDPKIIGNAGSFFKNPEIDAATFNSLKARFPDIIGYPLENGRVKLAAGWLIEQCGWKGKREGDAGVHALQALVLVNYGQASGQQIYDLSSQVLESVFTKFGVMLEREVNII